MPSFEGGGARGAASVSSASALTCVAQARSEQSFTRVNSGPPWDVWSRPYPTSFRADSPGTRTPGRQEESRRPSALARRNAQGHAGTHGVCDELVAAVHHVA